MDRGLTMFIWVWCGLVLASHLVGIGGKLYFDGVSVAIDYIQEMYSPFNFINMAVTVVTLLPAVGAYLWRDKRRQDMTAGAST